MKPLGAGLGRFGSFGRLGTGFGLIWTAVTVSGLGDGMRFIALPLLAAQVTDDPRQVAAVTLAEQLPWLLVGLIAGALADRLDRRRVLWTVDFARALVAGALAASIASGRPSVPLLAAAGFLLCCGQTLYTGAWSAVVPAIVAEPEARIRANAALQSGALVTATLLAPPLGALLFAIAPALPIGVDAVSFAVAAALVFVLRGDFSARIPDAPREPGKPGEPGAVRGLRRDVAEGVGWLRRQPVLRRLCLVAGATNFVTTGMIAVLVLYARDVLGLDGLGYGLLIAAFSVGGVSGAAAAPRLVRRFGTRRVLLSAVIGSAVTAAAAGAAPAALVAGCCVAGYGAMSLIWEITAVTLRQQLVPAELLGRVSMSYQLVSNGAGALGAATGGVLAQLAGLRTPFLAGAAVLALAALATARATDASPPSSAER
ncbi:MFS transporter [Streptomyces klenkii]|uniref:MFS transporter n=1 Tax=Streptomyces klenkii TaxID=1420899 RepID=UPI0033CFBEA6